MSRNNFFRVATTAVLLLLAGNVVAQEISASSAGVQKSSGSAAPTVRTTLRVQLVITRFDGEKKLASLPYTFLVTAGGSQAEMRMGVDAPVPMGAPGGPVQYRNIGTNISCSARESSDGRYWLRLEVQNSSALQGQNTSAPGAAPIFRDFKTSLDPVLRDGQSVQTIASTDPVTGEVVKIDVTLNVLK